MAATPVSTKKNGKRSDGNEPIKASACKLQVRHKGDLAVVEDSPATFVDFDGWVRVRFGLGAGDAVQYSNVKTGLELIPSLAIFAADDVDIEVTVLPRPTSSVPPPKKKAADPDVFLLFNAMLLRYLPVTVALLLAVCCVPNIGKSLDVLLLTAGLPVSKSLRAVAVDLFVPALCWAGPYLFIRRSLNPENRGVVFQKYAADAFFGALASSASAQLKPIVTNALKG